MWDLWYWRRFYIYLAWIYTAYPHFIVSIIEYRLVIYLIAASIGKFYNTILYPITIALYIYK